MLGGHAGARVDSQVFSFHMHPLCSMYLSGVNGLTPQVASYMLHKHVHRPSMKGDPPLAGPVRC